MGETGCPGSGGDVVENKESRAVLYCPFIDHCIDHCIFHLSRLHDHGGPRDLILLMFHFFVYASDLHDFIVSVFVYVSHLQDLFISACLRFRLHFLISDI